MSLRFRSFPILALALLLAVPAAAQEKSESREKPAAAEAKKAAAAEKNEKSGKAEKADEDEVPTFTTQDMRRKYGRSKPAPPNDAAGSGTAALERMQADRAAAKDVAAKRAAAQKRVEEAQAAVSRLEEQLRRMRNPFLGKPELTPQEREKLAGLDQAARIRRTEAALTDARAELAEARKELAASS